MERSTGIRDPKLDVTPVPEGFNHWLDRFMEMRGAESLTYSDIRAYEEVMDVKLSWVEVRGIRAMDRAASVAIAEILKESV